MSDVAGRNLIGYPRGRAMRPLADRAAHESGTLLDVNLEVSDTSTLLDLVEAGLGFALIPRRQRRSGPPYARYRCAEHMEWVRHDDAASTPPNVGVTVSRCRAVGMQAQLG